MRNPDRTKKRSTPLQLRYRRLRERDSRPLVSPPGTATK
jgi:hypothetical protein